VNSTEEFLQAIWGDLLGEIRIIGDAFVQSKFLHTNNYRFSMENLSLMNRDGAALYFGVTPRCRAGSKDEHCVSFHDWLWQDFDVPREVADSVEGGYKNAALERALEPLAVPSIIVDSGGGIQAYWRLESHVEYGLRKQIMKGMAAKHGGDHTYDKARVMRLPGFDNHKYGAPRLARILRFQPEQKYTLDAFSDYMQIAERESSIRRTLGPSKPLPTWLIDKMARAVPKGKRSETSFGVICKLIEHGWSFNEIEFAFRASYNLIGEKYRERGNGTRWLAVTYAAAMSSVTGTR